MNLFLSNRILISQQEVGMYDPFLFGNLKSTKSEILTLGNDRLSETLKTVGITFVFYFVVLKDGTTYLYVLNGAM